MYLDRILYPVTSLGPGKRLCIWVSGCNARCEGCANPELWTQRPEQFISVENLVLAIKKSVMGKEIEGITISGGEPFDQAVDVIKLLNLLNCKVDILVFSGYLYEEIKNDITKNMLLEMIDVLVDGKYIEELNDGKSALKGSSNQCIYILNEKKEKLYDDYLKQGRQIQNFVYDYKTLSVGIHKNDINTNENRS